MSERPEMQRVIVAGLNDSGMAPITITVKRFTEISGICRSTTYEMIKSGALRSVRIMGKRLIVVESYHRLVQQSESAE